jgi:hypothetical protein
MIGCPAVAACLDACWLGELSQHPMCPHSAHRRRCSHQPFVDARHSTHPSPLGFEAGLIPRRSFFISDFPPVSWQPSLASSAFYPQCPEFATGVHSGHGIFLRVYCHHSARTKGAAQLDHGIACTFVPTAAFSFRYLIPLAQKTDQSEGNLQQPRYEGIADTIVLLPYSPYLWLNCNRCNGTLVLL